MNRASPSPSLTVVFAGGFEPLHAGGLLGGDELDAVLLVASVQTIVFPIADLLRADARKLGTEEEVARTPTAVQFVRSERWDHGGGGGWEKRNRRMRRGGKGEGERQSELEHGGM